MKKLFALALLASTAFVPSAQAAFINGAVSFSGGIEGLLVSNTVVSALASITPSGPGAVASPNGAYAGTLTVTAAPFNIAAPGGVIYTTGPAGAAFAFTLVSIGPITTDADTSDSLFTDSISFQLRGIVTDLNGVLDATPFIGSFSADGACILAGGVCVSGTESASYSVAIVSSDTLPPPPPPTDVPAPATLALFGAALAGLGIARRRR